MLRFKKHCTHFDFRCALYIQTAPGVSQCRAIWLKPSPHFPVSLLIWFWGAKRAFCVAYIQSYHDIQPSTYYSADENVSPRKGAYPGKLKRKWRPSMAPYCRSRQKIPHSMDTTWGLGAQRQRYKTGQRKHRNEMNGWEVTNKRKNETNGNEVTCRNEIDFLKVLLVL